MGYEFSCRQDHKSILASNLLFLFVYGRLGIGKAVQKWATKKKLIKIFTDEWEVVIDPVAGSGVTLKAAAETNRNSYGFEVDRDFYKEADEKMLGNIQYGFSF